MRKIRSYYNLYIRFLLKKSAALLVLLIHNPLQAQVINDHTLPVNSQVGLNGNSFNIEGGTLGQNEINLFHSFLEFSVPTNYEAFFNNPQATQNIFARVTGGKLSNIDGRIQANGSASLFLLNPNGILFGPNASVNIGGSFIGTTANSIIFADGSEFSATNSLTIPQLTVNIPIGLQFRENQGVIQIQNTGHQLFRVGANAFELIVSPIFGREFTTGLKVQSGNTLAFVGGSIVLDGGILTAEEGRVQLGSVHSGLVTFLPTSLGWILDYGKVNSFGDIQLSRQALVDVSGNRSGSIQVQGAKISLTDGSTIFSQNQGTLSGEKIEVNATELLALTGISSNGLIPSQITSVTQGIGSGGDIIISTPKLIAHDGGKIGTLVLPQGSGRGGNVTVNASDSIELVGTSLPPALRASQIITETSSWFFGKTGDITVSTGQLTLINGANIVAGINIGNGSTGPVKIEATESVMIVGISSLSFVPSILGNGSLAGTGDIGSLLINTPKLVVRDGGNINTSVLGQGNAGNIVINASDLVEITGNRSELISSASRTDPEIAKALGLPENPTGISGSVTINTPRLLITDGAQVTVRNDGIGSAGTLLINANSIFLNNRGSITASTVSGNGGNIALNVQDTLRLRNNSFISATAGDTGNGGNIDINTHFLVAFPNENSDITANAFGGQGGAINITATGVFGLSIRDELTDDNDITAFSQLEPALNGIITLNTPEIDPSRGLIELPETVINPNTLIAQNPCKKGTQSELTLTGRGGLPPNPTDDLNPQATQVNLIEPAPTVETEGKQQDSSDTSSLAHPIVPAQGWIYNEGGEIVLTAYNPSATESQRRQTYPDGCPTP